MSQVIYKYEVSIADTSSIEMPKGAQLLSVQVQGDWPQPWALVDPSRPKVRRKLTLLGTGHPLPVPGEPVMHYIGTVQMNGGAFVFHLSDNGEQG